VPSEVIASPDTESPYVGSRTRPWSPLIDLMAITPSSVPDVTICFASGSQFIARISSPLATRMSVWRPLGQVLNRIVPAALAVTIFDACGDHAKELTATLASSASVGCKASVCNPKHISCPDYCPLRANFRHWKRLRFAGSPLCRSGVRTLSCQACQRTKFVWCHRQRKPALSHRHPILAPSPYFCDLQDLKSRAIPSGGIVSLWAGSNSPP
jgi:hypothetical protein